MRVEVERLMEQAERDLANAGKYIGKYWRAFPSSFWSISRR
jgi:hypothetical protein